MLFISIFALIKKKNAIYTLIKENLSGKELPIVNKGLDGSCWTFQPPISLSLCKMNLCQVIQDSLIECICDIKMYKKFIAPKGFGKRAMGYLQFLV